MKKVNLAKVLSFDNKCIGYAWRIYGNKYNYQNRNDLGLCLDEIDIDLPYNKKVDVGNGYYFYVLRGRFGEEQDLHDENTGYFTLSMVALLLKECYKHIFSFTKREQNRLEKHWQQYL